MIERIRQIKRALTLRFAWRKPLAPLKASLLAWLGLFVVAISAAQEQSVVLPERVQFVVDGYNLPEDAYSFYVQEVGAEAPLLEVNGSHSLSPASTAKVITTLAALEILGPDYVWYTDAFALGPIRDGMLEGDLLLRGSGDPFLVEEKLRAMLKALQRQGIHHITGDLVLDDRYFDASVRAVAPIDNEAGRAYNTLPYAVLTNYQVVSFYFQAHPNGQDVLIEADPALPNLHIDNQLRLGSGRCGGYQRGIRFRQDPSDPSGVIFDGSFPASCGQYRLLREVMTPATYTFGLFKQLWQELGGQIDGGVRIGMAPADQAPVLRWSSAPMSEIVRSVNKYSNNVMTRHLLLTLGAEEMSPPATTEKGVAVVRQYLAGKGIDISSLTLDNGAGLSRETRVTTAIMNQVLQHAWRSPYMPEFVASLPLNGMDGTMRNRLRSGEASGHMHIKTGSLNDVASVAGFVYARSGRIYAVSGILNAAQADRGPGIELLDALLLWVYQQ